jgi:hypothetical protein
MGLRVERRSRKVDVVFVVVVLSGSGNSWYIVKIVGPFKHEETAKMLARGFKNATAHRLTEA